MEQKQDLIHRINANYKKMSKGQKLIAEYILNNYDKAAFMTAAKLGKKVGVSESTVVRFANVLNYEGYPQLQKALQELIRNKLTTVQRIEMTSELDRSMVLKNVLKADINNLKLTIEEIDNQVFDIVVQRMLKADNIYILGLRSSAPLAQFMGYYLGFVFSNVRIVTSGVNDVFEQIMHISKDDLLIGISFPRYAGRTIEAMAFAKDKGAQIVALTDSFLSPLTSYADYTLLARSDMASFVDSLVAPLSLINSLIVAAGLAKKTDVSKEFSQLEKIWDEYKVYVSKDKE
ncbi:MurR/RpiR family transcriptional regulator [Xylanivirga thermophila]|jgi:DNA-binding MurR/RpiR family transcriptional regulator|uniref:MurR/RpiR family transcriptional regulator n=1 Tax=Xylanivirga thermophila TaxID=2496273 RepID=UPI00101C394E|nr:MurR/RpiR family transcriptional regulator [Xylanivirga thermophila]